MRAQHNDGGADRNLKPLDALAQRAMHAPVDLWEAVEYSLHKVTANGHQLAFGIAVSSLLMEIVRHLPADIGFLISKGGITSNDTLSKGLALRQVRLLGQIVPGVSVVKTEPNHPQFPELPVVLFPGNVGGPDGVASAYRRLHPQ